MTANEEAAYALGNRAAWVQLLRTCLRELGYDTPEASHAIWVKEREAVVAQLRSLCAEFGDNEWDERVHLGDVIEKHLGRHLRAPKGNG